MDWLKKNLSLVVGGVVALGLLGVAIYFLLNKKQAVDEVTVQLNAQTDELKKLAARDPHPNQENIEAARKEQEKLGGFLLGSRKFFVPVANFTNLDSAAFKNLLQTTISDMVHDAEKAGVTLPNSPNPPTAKYDFTFRPQRNSLVFAPETLGPLAIQVAEIKSICDVLFDARVHAMTGLRRVPVAKEDEGPTDYLVGKKATTNAVTGAVLAPYEVQFQGFTTELAAVLEGFYRSSNCFIVKNIDVQTNVVNLAADTAPAIPSFAVYPTLAPRPGVPQSRPGYDDLMLRRYGLGRYGRPSPLAPPPPAPAPGPFAQPVHKGPETILDERPFKVTMYIEAVRLIERAKSRSAK